MIFSIPIFVEARPALGSRPPWFSVRPLFQDGPVQKADRLGRALNKLTADLQQVLHELGREPRHDLLADWTFHPTLEETILDLRLELASGSQLRRFFLVGYPAFERKLFFNPKLIELHFEVAAGQTLAERAQEVFTRKFRVLEKEDAGFDPDLYALQGRARLTTLDLKFEPAVVAAKPAVSRRASLFGGPEEKDGEQELRRTGRPLHLLYPDDLERAVGRESEVEALGNMLASADRRSILLVGPRKVGKTTILHELVWQMCTRKKERTGRHRPVWLLSPMRLISGMSYLGEWENRVLAILDYAREKDQVLYFDDLLGLFTAGVSFASDLNVAQVLRPALEKRAVRVVAEITPEAWRVLRERDRAFADLFDVLPIAEPAEAETFRILVNVVRQLETRYRSAFEVQVVPAVYELHRRFAPDAAFPGKAAGFLRRLAVRYAGHAIGREQALEEFQQQSGLQLALLDEHRSVSRPEILEALRAGLKGQDHALEAFADVLVTLKARLNDPRRPLATLLLLGPTGVGKTQSAKVLAKYLFGSPERLLRFDMNEYVDSLAASRLSGTPDEPDGLLTSAIRRQPFSVVLFDEIEKAAPEVFDLLLAALDEGRLTDALGRVADFTTAVILLTSNLGARESRAQLGFRTGDAETDAVFTTAAEKFFRPEFFNRLDGVIPFRPLETAHLEGIAQLLIAQVFAREGLKRRECVLRVSPAAMGRLVELGCHARLGARALKRVVEREVAQPLAHRLAALAPGTPAVVRVHLGPEGLKLELQPLRPVARSVLWPEAVTRKRDKSQPAAFASWLVVAADTFLERMETEIETNAPGSRVELGKVSAEASRYFACREQFKKVERLAQVVDRKAHPARKRSNTAPRPKAKPTRFVVRQLLSGAPRLARLRDAVALQLELAEWEASESVEVPDSPETALLGEMALLEAMAAGPQDGRLRVLVFHTPEEANAADVFRLAQLYQQFFNEVWGCSATFLFQHFAPEEVLLRHIFGEKVGDFINPVQAVLLEGPAVARLVSSGAHTVLIRRTDGFTLTMMHTRIVASKTEAEQFARDCLSAGDADGNMTVNPGGIIQVVHRGKTITDFRTGVVVPAEPSNEEFRALMLSGLDLPREVEL